MSKINLFRYELKKLKRANLNSKEAAIYDQLLPQLIDHNSENLKRLAAYAFISYELKVAKHNSFRIWNYLQNRRKINYFMRCLIYCGNGLGFNEPSYICYADLIFDCDPTWPDVTRFMEPEWEL